jgi:hypothetical protein
VRNKYQRKERKSNHKFEIVRGQELLVRVLLPMAESVGRDVEELTGQARLQILCAILENEVASISTTTATSIRPHPGAAALHYPWRMQAVRPPVLDSGPHRLEQADEVGGLDGRLSEGLFGHNNRLRWSRRRPDVGECDSKRAHLRVVFRFGHQPMNRLAPRH